MSYDAGKYDVAVIGAGHAGIEAALASARLGCRTVIFTINMDAVGNCPCNPSIGGTAKGHLVREVDALGGEMGKTADECTLQSRMLNLGKGPAVHSLRAQIDRNKYARVMKHKLEQCENLVMRQAEVIDIKRDGEWVFAGIARPGLGADHKATLVEHMDGTEKECLLYLPLFDEVKTLEIGVDAGARIEAAPNPFRHRIVVIGSSITHGTGLSRPGMAYPAQLERATGFEFVNLGASGQCKMEQFFAHVAAACEADAFLFDSFSNPSAQQIEERLEPFVATIRAAHPTTPLIFLQTEVRESRNFNDKIRKFEDDKRAASEAGMQRLLKQDKNIYFLNPGMPLGDDHDATVDGVHPSDLGHGRILEVIRPQIVNILKKHDIR